MASLLNFFFFWELTLCCSETFFNILFHISITSFLSITLWFILHMGMNFPLLLPCAFVLVEKSCAFWCCECQLAIFLIFFSFLLYFKSFLWLFRQIMDFNTANIQHRVDFWSPVPGFKFCLCYLVVETSYLI